MAGVKVTYIETRFVTSDAAGFKDLVQRLTGRSPVAAASAPAPAAAPHRPLACRPTAAGCGPQGYYYQAPSPSPAALEARVGDAGSSLTPPPCLGETYGVGDCSGMLHGGASQDAQWGHGGGNYSDYFQC
ncbi:unnamed protein product [Urochloa humidicola]